MSKRIRLTFENGKKIRYKVPNLVSEILDFLMESENLSSESEAFSHLLDIVLSTIPIDINDSDKTEKLKKHFKYLKGLKKYHERIEKNKKLREKEFNEVLSKGQNFGHQIEGMVPVATVRELMQSGTLGCELYKSLYNYAKKLREKMGDPITEEWVEEYPEPGTAQAYEKERFLNDNPWVLLFKIA